MVQRLNAVVQQDRTGCALASVAAVAGTSYPSMRKAAADMRILVTDTKLWTSTKPIRRLLTRFGVRAARNEQAFISWEGLPDRALLAIKWHREKTGPAWHWAVF